MWKKKKKGYNQNTFKLYLKPTIKQSFWKKKKKKMNIESFLPRHPNQNKSLFSCNSHSQLLPEKQHHCAWSNTDKGDRFRQTKTIKCNLPVSVTWVGIWEIWCRWAAGHMSTTEQKGKQGRGDKWKVQSILPSLYSQWELQEHGSLNVEKNWTSI